jgi:succinate dehydrogenase / fumarate reductase membrane anchor subunit
MLLFLSIWLLHVLATQDFSYAVAIHEMQRPGNWVPMALLVVVGLQHSWLGVRVVIEDYVHGKALKFATLLVVELLHYVVGATGLFALIKIVSEAHT